MADREKVIRALTTCKKTDCANCEYNTEVCLINELLSDALELLKEQEACQPKTGHWIWLQYCANEGVYCSECHTKMFACYPMKKKLSLFCGHCGAKMGDEVESR